MIDTSLYIKEVKLHRLQMELKSPFTTSFGMVQRKDFFLIEAIDQTGLTGYGESVAFSAPWYTEETTSTVFHMMTEFLLPLLFEKPISHPDQVNGRFRPVRRNPMAKAALEGAVWDLYAKLRKLPLAQVLGGTQNEIEVGVSIGIQQTTKEMLCQIERFQDQGYNRVKVKIKPGQDVQLIKEIRQAFPDLQLMADANSAYTPDDTKHLKQLDDYGLIMLEQPLGYNDFAEHAAMQKSLSTPICLDESIASFHDAKQAVELNACRVINLKVGRVGGFTEAKKIHDFAVDAGIPVWCGGMLEAGVGRAHSLAISSLSGFVYPGDTSGSDRYWKKDIIKPEITAKGGKIMLSDQPGIGYAVDWEMVEKVRTDYTVIKNPNF